MAAAGMAPRISKTDSAPVTAVTAAVIAGMNQALPYSGTVLEHEGRRVLDQHRRGHVADAQVQSAGEQIARRRPR
jgi:hypothetical protein